jgi:hypothetical protein
MMIFYCTSIHFDATCMHLYAWHIKVINKYICVHFTMLPPCTIFFFLVMTLWMELLMKKRTCYLHNKTMSIHNWHCDPTNWPIEQLFFNVHFWYYQTIKSISLYEETHFNKRYPSISSHQGLVDFSTHCSWKWASSLFESRYSRKIANGENK